MAKILLIFLCILSVLFTGCSSSKQVDKASIAETVTAGKRTAESATHFICFQARHLFSLLYLQIRLNKPAQKQKANIYQIFRFQSLNCL